jgi:hypothetical protein
MVSWNSGSSGVHLNWYAIVILPVVILLSVGIWAALIRAAVSFFE